MTTDYTKMMFADYRLQMEAAFKRDANTPPRYPKADKPQVPTDRERLEAQLQKIRDARDGHLYRLSQAQDMLRKAGYVLVTTESGEEKWVLLEAEGRK
ncbi:hypothetical protein QO002_002906 [Pararhizobium capsulatum DSM 1112]|uniref:Uncharacterized protein n=1 Tax=Pararhizobium capsulatum DSM 1112 TaxID=1121113 RepID=A0ABU0BS35_9HYPH|nr:hypothetical protein [Pararhizobium capsulatum]MDQ0320768.1 hypothetical protein [Pararhizobium capsulatum DSM 1112]